MTDAPERIWAWRTSENISPDHVRFSFKWIGGQLKEPSHEGTDFLAGYIRADLSPSPEVVKELVEALRANVTFAEKIADAIGIDLEETALEVRVMPEGREVAHRTWAEVIAQARAVLAKLEGGE